MSLPIISADQRLAERRDVKGVLVGKSGIGKTSQLWTLEPESTLFFDLEAGDLAVEGYAGDTIRPRTWQECRDFAVFIGGPCQRQTKTDTHTPGIGNGILIHRRVVLFG